MSIFILYNKMLNLLSIGVQDLLEKLWESGGFHLENGKVAVFVELFVLRAFNLLADLGYRFYDVSHVVIGIKNDQPFGSGDHAGIHFVIFEEITRLVAVRVYPRRDQNYLSDFNIFIKAQVFYPESGAAAVADQ